MTRMVACIITLILSPFLAGMAATVSWGERQAVGYGEPEDWIAD